MVATSFTQSLSYQSGKSSLGPRVQHDVSAGKQPESNIKVIWIH